jgi:hypothetical protein
MLYLGEQCRHRTWEGTCVLGWPTGHIFAPGDDPRRMPCRFDGEPTKPVECHDYEAKEETDDEMH